MKRNRSVDLIRIIASFGVIAIHVQSSTPAASFFTYLFWPLCVPFFFTASIFFFIQSVHRLHSLKANLLKIGQRLYVPFIAWSIVYTILLLIKNAVTHQNKDFSFWRIFIYGGSSVQMYFQPLLINIQLLILGSIFLIKKRNLLAALLVLISLSVLIIGDVYDCFGFGATGQDIGIATYILFGYGLLKLATTNRTKALYIGLGLLMLTITYLSLLNSALNVTIGGFWIFFPFGGIALMLLCFGINIPTLPKWAESISNNTYGIFLSHIVFLEFFELFVVKVFKGIEYTLINKFIFTLCVFVAANFFVQFIRRISILKKLFLGEP